MTRAPFKYLDYYQFEDADLFFGREKQTQRMVGEILASRLLVLFSPSGSGKTSLINAGVRPKLEQLGYQTIYTRLEKTPVLSIQEAVGRALAHSASAIGAVSDGLYDFLKSASVIVNKPLILFLDQFEEFFIIYRHEEAIRREFIEQLARVKYDDALPVFIVLSLREDYFAHLHEFREAIPSIFQNNANIRLEAFSEEEARRAIVEPVQAVGVEIEDALTERMIQDLKNGKSGIQPIELQIVCHKVWNNRAGNHRVTRAAYNAAGGAQNILSTDLSDILNTVPRRQQGLMVRVLEALKTPDNTKRYRSFEDLQETLAGAGPSRLRQILKKLSALDVLRHEQRSGTDWYEFKHDYLVGGISQWIHKRREKLHRKRVMAGLVPGIVLAVGLIVYLVNAYHTFYATTYTELEYKGQQTEISIDRGRPFRFDHFATTGLFLNDLRDIEALNRLDHDYKINSWDPYDWTALVGQLRPSLSRCKKSLMKQIERRYL